MKSWLIPSAIVALMIAGATAGVFAYGGRDGESAAETGGTAHYEVVVRFNTSVEQGDIDATSDLLRAYDTGLDFIVQESWPPTGVANLQTNTLNFCDTIINELSSRSYIEDFSCGPQRVFDGGIEDMPVVNSDGASTQPACEPGASECDDTLDTCGDIGNLAACDDPVLEPLDGDSGPIRSDEGIDPNECNQVHNIDACDSGGVTTSPVCAPDVPDCEDTVVTTCDGGECEGTGEDGLPVAPDGASVTGSEYRVIISFNTSVTQPDLDETAAFLGSFDAGLEFLVQESWPPTGVASVQTDMPNFCDAIFDELASQSYITDFSCNPQQIFDGGIEDMPVTNLPDVE